LNLHTVENSPAKASVTEGSVPNFAGAGTSFGHANIQASSRKEETERQECKLKLQESVGLVAELK
jgi:hypothetical protein